VISLTEYTYSLHIYYGTTFQNWLFKFITFGQSQRLYFFGANLKAKVFISLILVSSFLTPLISGCATMKESLLLGASVGATSGGAIGNAIGTHNHNTAGGTITGALTGAAIGAGLAYFMGKRFQDSNLAESPISKSGTSKVPTLSSPEVRRIWVPAKIEGSKFIDGHFEFIIERQSVWTDQ